MALIVQMDNAYFTTRGEGTEGWMAPELLCIVYKET